MSPRPPHPRRRWPAALVGAALIGLAWTGPGSADALGDGRFRDEVAGVVQAMRPGAAILPDPDPRQIKVDRQTIALTNLYPRVAPLAGAERRRVIEEFLAALLRPQSGAASVVEPSFAEVKDRLRVQLVPTETLRQAPQVASRPFSQTLLVVYVLDEPARYRYVTRDMLVGWAVEASAVETVAVANLAAASKDAAFNLALADGEPAVAMATAGDDYDAARLMLPRYLESMRKALKAEAIVLAAPTRDLLMAWPADSPARRGLAAEARKQMRAGPYGRSDELFRFDREGLRPLDAAGRVEHGR